MPIAIFAKYSILIAREASKNNILTPEVRLNGSRAKPPSISRALELGAVDDVAQRFGGVAELL